MGNRLRILAIVLVLIPGLAFAISPSFLVQRGSTAGDTTPPTLSTVAIGTNGTSWTFTYDENVTGSPTSDLCDAYVVTMSAAGAITLTYASGDGSTSVVCTGSPSVVADETVTVGLNYTQPGNGIEDMVGNDLANISSKGVTNNSTATITYFGYTTVGGTPYTLATSWWRNKTYVAGFNCPGSGNQRVTELTAYVSQPSGSPNIRLAVYNTSAVVVCEGTSEVAIGTSAAWQGHIGSSTIKVAGGSAPCTLTGGTQYDLAFSVDGITAVGYYNAGSASDWTYESYDMTGGFIDRADTNDTPSRWSVRCGVQ